MESGLGLESGLGMVLGLVLGLGFRARRDLPVDRVAVALVKDELGREILGRAAPATRGAAASSTWGRSLERMGLQPLGREACGRGAQSPRGARHFLGKPEVRQLRGARAGGGGGGSGGEGRRAGSEGSALPGRGKDTP